MKQLSGFAVISVNGGDRVSYTYDEINDAGELVSENNKRSFYLVDDEAKAHVDALKEIIRARMEAQ